MPVVTRSQYQSLTNAENAYNTVVNRMTEVNRLVGEMENIRGRENKSRQAIKVFQHLNTELLSVFSSSDAFIPLILLTLIYRAFLPKLVEFKMEYYLDYWSDIHKNLTNDMIREIDASILYIHSILQNKSITHVDSVNTSLDIKQYIYKHSRVLHAMVLSKK